MCALCSGICTKNEKGTSVRSTVIPDIKLRSPQEGDLFQGRDPVEIAKALAAAGAPVLSGVTEPKFCGLVPTYANIASICKCINDYFFEGIYS